VLVAVVVLAVVAAAGGFALLDDEAEAGLGAPASPAVEETASTMLRLGWASVADADYYEVSVDGAAAALTLRSDSPELQVPGLKADSSYKVRVRAVGADDSSRFSTTVTTRTSADDEPQLLVPAHVDVAAPQPRTLRVTWESVEGATGYEVQSDTDDAFKHPDTVRSDSRSARLTGLDGDTAYSVRVRAIGAHDTRSAWSAVSTVTTLAPTDDVPVRIATFNVRCHSCGGPSWSSRRGAVAATIESQHPDVVGLQEAQQSRPSGFGTSQFADIVKALGEIGATYRVTDPAIGASKGTRIVYDPDTLVLLDTGAIRYSSQRRGATTRYAAWAVFRQRATGQEFVFASTHLEPLSVPVRTAQARQLGATLEQIADGRPTMAVGDFNASQFRQYQIHDAMTSNGFVDPLGIQRSSKVAAEDAPVEKRIRSNYDSFNDSRRSAPIGTSDPDGNGIYLDYLFTTPMRALEFENVVDIDSSGRYRGVVPSDHNMLRLDVVLPD